MIPRRNDPLLTGLTGLYCAGKNHVAALLEKRGIPVLDLDRLGHEVIDGEAGEAIIRRFGSAVLDGQGRIDRRLVGRRVFGRPEELAALEAIVHPGVNRLTVEWIAARTAEARRLAAAQAADARYARPVCVINAALLHKSAAWPRLDALIVVRAPLPVRILRARRRDRLPLGELIRRLRSQRDFPWADLRRKTNRCRAEKFPGGPQLFSAPSDRYIIANSGFPGSQRRLEKRVDELLELLRNFSF